MIEVRNLTKYYNEVKALDNINFSVSRGEILGFLGPNGAGKTTTLRILTGYLSPSKGDIRIGDYTLPDDILSIKSIMGYLPESVPIYKNMMVYEYLWYVGEVRGIDKKRLFNRIKDVARRCQITNIMHKNIAELSKGLLQRVGIANVLLHDPEILILDEPTTGLDPNQILEIRELIREIGRKKTVILSSHILSEVEATCDRIIIVNKGKIVADGTPRELKALYQGARKIEVVLKGPSSEEVASFLKSLQGVRELEVNEDKEGVYCTLLCDGDIREVLYNSIKSTPWILLEFHNISTSLENIFKEITREN